MSHPLPHGCEALAFCFPKHRTWHTFSMASIQQGTTTVKPTFAKASLASHCTPRPLILTWAQVAASGYKPPNANKQNQHPNTKSKSPVASPPSQNSSSVTPETAKIDDCRNGVPQADVADSEKNHVVVSVGNAAKRPESAKIAETTSTVKLEAQRPRDANARPSTSNADDGNTQVSSSNSSAKQTGLDTKSVVSVATFGMDEKESLRPEDSASLKATEEEDRLSTQGSGPTGSRIGSDSGARAFREQLHEISNVTAPAPRAAPINRFTPTMILSADSTYDGPIVSENVQVASLAQPLPTMIPPPIPDERLIEALASGRDRVWVLKLEQDIIDFLKDSGSAWTIRTRRRVLTKRSEKELTLPQCNSFYRMLAHKLADYYMLDHTVDSTVTGAAVIIRRTPFSPPLYVYARSFRTGKCLLETYRPPPLSALPNPSSVASTPPPNVAARKIMRRANDGNPTSFPSTTANSEGPSKTTSEAGGESNSDGGAPANGALGKTTLTREEREAKYAEVRLRIFGTLEQNEAGETENKPEENDESRTSSASGKKKSKKQRNDSDDFEPRSLFQVPAYYPPQGYEAAGMAYYNPLGPGNQYPMMPQHGPVTYPNSYQQIIPSEQQGQYQYPGSAYVPYGHPTSTDYDLAAAFQRGMQSFQNTSPSPQMQSRSPMAQTNVPQSQYQVQLPQYNQQWQPIPYGQQYPQPMYMAPQYPDRPMSSPGQLPPNGAYPFQPPNTAPPYQTGHQHKMQSPMQPSFVGRQFNPQSQAFVPGHRIPPHPPQQQMQQMPQLSSMQPIHMAPIPRLPHQQMHFSPQPPPMASLSRQTSSSYNSPRLPTQTPTFHPNTFPMTSTPIYSAPAQYTIPPTNQQQQQPLSHPLPTPPNPTSSIAKWGTPAHLPAKPPPPQTLEPLKYNELTRAYQGLPGMPFVGPNGVQPVNGAGLAGTGYTGNMNGVSVGVELRGGVANVSNVPGGPGVSGIVPGSAPASAGAERGPGGN